MSKKTQIGLKASALLVVLTAATSALDGLSKFLDKWVAFLEKFTHQPYYVRWPTIGLFLAGCAALVWRAWRARPPRSSLLRPDAFHLDPDNPKHLKGRETDIKKLLVTCADVQLVWLVGESGSGKTALIRSGLIPKLNEESKMCPLYLESWGQDWVAGPLDSLTISLQRTISDRDRISLGFGRPITSKDTFELLASFRSKIGKTPLLIFDQFDDFQAAYRAEFRQGNIWRNSTTIIEDNSFFANVSEQLKAGFFHVLFLTRADAADGLEAVRFVEPVSFRLDRLAAENVVPLLRELTLTPPDKDPVVADPEFGWRQLQERLKRDLSRDGVVLPIQIQMALRGLASLPNPVLTVRNYERNGGLVGLEAGFVERSVASSARLLNIDPAQIRAMLLALVDGNKTVPRSELELSRFFEGVPIKEQTGLFDELEKSGMVRRIASISNPGLNTEVPASDVISLYHDYLCRGVIAADQRANRWRNLIKESHRAFDEAVGSWRARWRALLSPNLQFQLLWQRLRGRDHFRYGEDTAFAWLSVLRFSTWLAMLALVGGVAFYIITERDQQETRRLAGELVKEISLTGDDDLRVPNSKLWSLAGENADVRRAFWKEALSSNEDSQLLIGKTPYAFVATIGLDPDGNEKRNLDRNILRPLLQQAQAHPGSLSLAAHLYALIGRIDSEPRTLLNQDLLAALKSGDSISRKLELIQALDTVPGQLSAGHANVIFHNLLDARTNESVEPYRELYLAQALKAVAVRLSAEQTPSAFDDILRVFRDTQDSRGKADLAEALTSVTWNPSPERQSRFRDLLAILRETNDGEVTQRLAKALIAVADKLSPEQADGAFDEVVDNLKKADDAEGNDESAQVLAAVSAKLSAERAKDALDDLVLVLTRSSNPNDKLWLAKALAAVPVKLPAEQAKLVFDNLVAALGKPNHGWTQFVLAQALAVVPGRLSAEQADIVFNHLLNQVKEIDTLDQIRDAVPLARALSVVPGKLSAEQIRSAFDCLIGDMKKNEDPSNKFGFAQAISFVPGKLSSEQAKSVFDDLVTAMPGADRNLNGHPEDLRYALHYMAGKVSSEQAPLAFKSLIDALKNTDSPHVKIDLVRALAAVPGRPSAEQIKATFDTVLKSLKSPITWGTNADEGNVKAGLVLALSSVSGKRSDTDQRMLVEVLKWPTCIGEMRKEILKQLEAEAGQKFNGDVSAAARWARALGLDVTTPPQTNFSSI